jgi:hypothetical protein
VPRVRRVLFLSDAIRRCDSHYTKALSQLDQQGEQLDRVEGDVNKINADMKEAEKHITGMEKWCGIAAVCPWNRTLNAKWNKSASGKSNYMGNVSEQPNTGNVTVIQRINNVAREEDMEENMQAVGGMMCNLKAMAQDRQIDRVSHKSSFADLRIDQATEKIIK